MTSVNKFYLRDSASWVSGTMPATNATVSATTPTKYGASMANKWMSSIAGSAQTSVSGTTNSGTAAQSMVICRWISDPLDAQTISSQTIEFSGAFSEDDAKSNFLPSVVIAVWRPSNGTLVGRIYDQATNVAEPGTSEGAGSFTATSTSVTASAGDVLVVEVWRKSNAQQSPGAASVNAVYYDGATEASSSDNAMFVGFTTAVVTSTQTWTATADVSVSPTTSATSSNMSKSATAAITVTPSVAAIPTNLTKTTTATAVSVTPTVSATGDLWAVGLPQERGIAGTSKTYGTLTGAFGFAGSTEHLADATNTTVSPTVAASGFVTSFRTATSVTMSPASAATPSAMTKTGVATATTSPTPSATPSAITKSIGATGVTVSPTVASTPAAVIRPLTATGVDVTPTTTASLGIVTKPGTVTLTVTPTVTADPAAIVDTSSATAVTVSPTPAASGFVTDIGTTIATTVGITPSATAAAIVDTSSATAVTITPTVAAALGAKTSSTTAAVTVSPSSSASGSVVKSSVATTTLVSPVPVAGGQAWRSRYMRPDAILSMSGLTGSYTDIQDSPTSPDGNGLVPTGGAISVRFSFENHGQTLRTEADDQTVRVLVTVT